jgi:hypothetical protein
VTHDRDGPPPLSSAEETHASHEVMELVRSDSDLSLLVVQLREAGKSWREVKAVMDTLIVQGGAGDDIIDASGMAAAGMQFIVDGGDGNDVLHGGQGMTCSLVALAPIASKFSGLNRTDTITDFQRGLDKIDITGYGGALNKFGDLAGHISQVGADTHVDLARSPGPGLSFCRTPRWRRSAHPTLRSSSLCRAAGRCCGDALQLPTPSTMRRGLCSRPKIADGWNVRCEGERRSIERQLWA